MASTSSSSPRSSPTSSPGEVSLASRLSWLGAALWVIAVKVVVVVTWTPVEITAPRARVLIYAMATVLPFLPLTAIILQSALHRQVRAGVLASAATGILLYGLVASGLAATAWNAGQSWETRRVLYRHVDDPDRTIERQHRESTAEGRASQAQIRIVQTRPITSFLSYTETAKDTLLDDNWRQVDPESPWSE